MIEEKRTERNISLGRIMPDSWRYNVAFERFAVSIWFKVFFLLGLDDGFNIGIKLFIIVF